jgi:hypothetical protein
MLLKTRAFLLFQIFNAIAVLIAASPNLLKRSCSRLAKEAVLRPAMSWWKKLTHPGPSGSGS